MDRGMDTIMHGSKLKSHYVKSCLDCVVGAAEYSTSFRFNLVTCVLDAHKTSNKMLFQLVCN